MNLKLLTVAAVVSTTVAAPALAQDSAARAHHVRYQEQTRPYQQRDTGFWPGDLAAGVVGGAVATAGAIATAPFRHDTYAYNDRYYGHRYHGGYNNGFVCQTGTTFMGEDGRRHICQ
jgi:hypothetical protein